MIKFFSWAAVLIFFLLSPLAVLAVATPDFPACPNPGGTILASYPDGTHGVPGSATTYTGSDSVYQIGENTVVQCFCTQGSGIQTNWWKFSSLTAQQIETLKGQGWIYVPDGSAWGLEPAPYLAYNLPGSCGTQTTGAGADSGGGPGNPSAPVCGDEAPRGAPQLLSAQWVSSRSVKLTWTEAPDPVTCYLLAYGPQSGVYSYGQPNIGPRGTTTYTVNDLTPGQTYYFVVRAGNGCKPGPFSGELSSGAGLGWVAGWALAYDPQVLSQASSPSADPSADFLAEEELEPQSCARCFWLPILAVMIAVLAAYYLAMSRRPWTSWRWVVGSIVALVAYVVFLIVNIDCLEGVIDLKIITLPCRLFWLVDLATFVTIAWLAKKYLTKPQV